MAADAAGTRGGTGAAAAATTTTAATATATATVAGGDSGSGGTAAVHAGCAVPYGATCRQGGTNFAVYAREESHVRLLLYRPGNRDTARPDRDLALDPATHRTGLVWHVEVRPPVPRWSYLWRVGREKDPRWRDNLCLDPWALILDSAVGPAQFNKRGPGEIVDGNVRGPHAPDVSAYRPRAVVPAETDLDFDWQGVERPKIPWKDLVIYEMHVRGFTVDPSAAGTADGTFLGIVERIPYLKQLGVNCVELLPVHEFNEKEWSHINPVTNAVLSQYWGYSTVAFFAPMNRFGRDGTEPHDVLRDFKIMVRELHRAGIEIVLDVVYNHTAEMGLDYLPPGHFGMKTLAPFSYYLLEDEGKKFVNHTGCGNTVNSNNVVVQELICESLKYWVHSMGVDGFRFDLASVLCRGTDGTPLQHPPVVERMSKDPTMRDVKLIAEPWDCGGMYQVGNFPHYGVWAEWNGKYRDVVRRFIKGNAHMISDFATRICGSQDLYGAGRKPYHSINFVTAHDGFTMHDMVAYNHKHNDHNGENNNDGEAHNDSWNCGAEGETKDPAVLSLRLRQIKNMLVALLVSTGTPMVRMGDEYAHTQRGNNNGWCQDSDLTWFSWKYAAEQRNDLVRFTRMLIKFRLSTPALRHSEFLSKGDVTWHGTTPHSPDWNSGYNFIAFVLHGAEDVYVAFNAGDEGRAVALPSTKGNWLRVIDTNLESPKDCSEDPSKSPMSAGSYTLKPYSAIVLKQSTGGHADRHAVPDGLADSFSVASISPLLG
jgi:isoamylase